MTDTNTAAIIELASVAERARIGIRKTADGREFIIVTGENSESSVEWLTGYKEAPQRITAHKHFDEGESLARYVNTYKDENTVLFAGLSSNTVKALIDYHGKDEPATVDHTAVWSLQHSPEFITWNAMNKKYQTQDDFIRFLEENAADVVQPSPAGVLEMCRDFGGLLEVKFGRMTNLANGDKAIQYTTTTNLKASISVPQMLTLNIPIYRGEERVNIQTYFRYRNNEQGVFFAHEFHRLEPIKEAAFRQAVTACAEACGLTPFYGAV